MAEPVVGADDDQIFLIVADLDKFTAKEIVALALNMDANLREDTPVDTGWARANWIPSVGEPALLDSHLKDPNPGAVMAREQVHSAGLNAVLGWKVGDGPIFVTNNVPYIGALNNGHSAQAPAGFVQIALERAVRQTGSAAGNKAIRARRGAAARAVKPRRR